VKALASHTAAIVLILLFALELRAQSDEECQDGRIASIQIITEPIFAEGAADSVNGALSKVYAAANWLHIETRETFVRRELLFREGDCAERLPLTESERILRGFRFLEAASVESTQRPDGDVDVTVTTKDDWSLRLEPRFNFGGGFAVTGIKVGDSNLDGRGRLVELSYILRSGQDDVLLSYFDPQFLMTRWDFSLGVLRGGAGWTVGQAVAFPFIGLVGRKAAFQNALYSEREFRYVVGDSKESTTELLLPTLQKTFGLGGGLRTRPSLLGRSTRLWSSGLSLSYEDTRYSSSVFEDSTFLSSPGVAEAIGGATSASVLPRNSLRLNVLGGVRWLDYVKREGVSTLRAVEDIALGASADVLVGAAPEWFGLEDSHVLLGFDLYGGTRVRGNWFSALRMNAEARRDLDTGKWRDRYAAFLWTNFWVVSSRSTNELTASYSAGWKTTVPFQLTLGGPYRLGGYSLDRFPSGARAVLRLENRYNLTRLGKLIDFGSVVFFDLGEAWSNGALFGVDSGLRASAGIGLRFAVPAGSRQTYRLQIGIPLDDGVNFGDFVFSLSIDRLLRVETDLIDPQLARSRDPAIRSAGRFLK
jgi:hypothetical protein